MTERDGYEHGVPCWVETWQADPDTAARLYAGVLSWEVKQGTSPGTDTRYYMCRLGGTTWPRSARPAGRRAARVDHVRAGR